MNKSSQCEICSFRNPRATVTAVIAQSGRVLLARRSEAPYKGWWDLIGGYMHEDEVPEDALKREVKEELGVDCSLRLLGLFPGYALWKGQEFPILSIAHRVKLGPGPLRPNAEVAEIRWFALDKLPRIAFDSNNKIINHVKTRRPL